MKGLLEKTRDMNKIIQQAAGHPISFNEMAETLSINTESNVYIIGKKGKILGYSFVEGFSSPNTDEIFKLDGNFSEKYNEFLLKNLDTTINVDKDTIVEHGEEKENSITDEFTTIVPIMGGGQRLGTLMLSKVKEFVNDDLILAEYAATMIGMEILRAKVEKVEDIARQKSIVSIAFDTLSYSELEAIEHIFNELGDTHGLLVASKIADKVGITRSLIVNALRKLESAGVVEVRSLGMKGTYIRVLNEHLLDELDRIKTSHGRI